MEAGISDHIWSVQEIVGLKVWIESQQQLPAQPAGTPQGR
jgi:hypothetical protein